MIMITLLGDYTMLIKFTYTCMSNFSPEHCIWNNICGCATRMWSNKATSQSKKTTNCYCDVTAMGWK